MPTGQTSTDIEQNGRDTNILSWYLDGNPALEPIENYGRFGKLLYLLVTSLLNGTVFRYGGRVDSVDDLPETGTPNEFYFVGPEDSENYDEYIWVVNEEEEHGGHWDRVGSISIIIDDHLDTQSTNPVQNSVITLAINGLTVCLATAYDTTASYVVGSYCTRGQTLYKSNAVQNPAGEWDSSKWQAVTVMGELMSALAGLATVARTGSYNDLTDKPTIPTVSDRLKSIAAAAAYDPSHTYVTGEYMTLNGELYKYDANGSYAPIGENLLVTYAARMKDSTYGYQNNNYLESYGTASVSDHGNMYISGTIPLKQNTRYKIYEAGWPVKEARYSAVAIFTNANMANFYERALTYGYNGTSATGTFSTGSYQYISLSMPKDDTLASQYYLYELTSQTFTKTTVADELGEKANTADIPDAVTVTNTGDVYIGTQLIRKVLTQAEYDLLDPPDPKVDYLIVPAST